MLVSERRAAVIAAVRRRGAATIAELVDELGVSPMTVRRDIDMLDADGRITKVRGGASARDGHQPRAATPAASGLTTEQRAIAREAASLVEPGMAVGVSGGAVTWLLADALRTVPDITIVTNSLPVADLFARPDRADEPYTQTVVLTGGVRTPADSFVGPVAVRALEHLHLDMSFLSATGVDQHAGLTTSNLLEAETERALVAAAREAVVLADHRRWGSVSLTTIIDLSQADRLITDEGMPADARAIIESLVPTLTIAALEA